MLPISIQNLLIHCVVEFFPGVVISIDHEELIYLYICVLYLPSLLVMTVLSLAFYLSLSLSLSLPLSL